MRKLKIVWSSIIMNSQYGSDIGKTFGFLLDQRTGNHMENPNFTGRPKLLQELIFFQH